MQENKNQAAAGLLICDDAKNGLRALEPESIDCIITSPPYWQLRDYSTNGQIGLEETPEEYINTLVSVFRDARRALKPSGTLWLVIGDSYVTKRGNTSIQGKTSARNNRRTFSRPVRSVVSGLKIKDLVGIPWMLAFALRADGWYLRQDIIWHKPNCMPESVQDRCVRAHEYVFLLTKSPRYYYDAAAIREPAEKPVSGDGKRTRRGVWSVSTRPFPGSHFATFPPELVTPCILAGSPVGGRVLDPFGGTGTVVECALQNNRRAIMIDNNADYIALAKKRLEKNGFGNSIAVA